MKVAVITPYYQERLELLVRCHDSVVRQTHPCTQFMIADGHPRHELSDWPVEHMILPRSHGDAGNTPRGLGAVSALNLGYEGFAFLDADNWLADDHIETMVSAVAETGASVVFSDRFMVLPTGDIVDNNPEDVQRTHVDTNCFFITASAARLLPLWAMMHPTLGPLGDRVMLHLTRRNGFKHVWTGKKTVYYETNYVHDYRKLGGPIPASARRTDRQAVAVNFARERNTERLGFELRIGIGPNANDPARKP